FVFLGFVGFGCCVGGVLSVVVSLVGGLGLFVVCLWGLVVFGFGCCVCVWFGVVGCWCEWVGVGCFCLWLFVFVLVGVLVLGGVGVMLVGGGSDVDLLEM
ncbi:hypothetical protein RA269_27860, partial [Pseudomonas syringae pv. tagetis]|uniref:hypothetical protein n=1 Tax=Pseudomonas syringae group genomosp. 7 TaxID=251699 RepID=UPI00376FE7B2